MASLQVLDEKIGAKQRELETAIEAQEKLLESIDALEAKDELSAEDSADLSAKATASRKQATEINRLQASISQLQADRQVVVDLQAAKEFTKAPAPRQSQPVAAGATRIETLPPSKEQLDHDIGAFFQAQYLSAKTRARVRDIFRGDDEFAEYRNDRLLAATNTTSNAAVIPPMYQNRVIELLRAATVFNRMEGITRLPLANGNLRLPRQSVASAAAYTAEEANIATSDVQSDQIDLAAKKLTAMVPQSGELVRRSDPSIMAMVRDDIIKQIAQKMDSTFLRNTANLTTTPKGLKHYGDASSAAQRVDAVTVGSATVALVNGNLTSAMLLLDNANVPNINRYWLMAPRSAMYLTDLIDSNGNRFFPEMARGMLKGYPVLVTTNIPINLTVTIGSSRANSSEIYLLEATEWIIAEAPTFQIDVSDVAPYHDGSNVVSAFSRDEVVFRAIVEHDTALKHAASVAYLQGVNWA